MADQTNSWHGAVNTSWTEDGNWTLGTAPQTDTSNDTLIFLPDARNPPRANLDRSGDAAGVGLRPTVVHVLPDVRYDIGQPGGELIMDAARVVHNGRGTLYYKVGGTGSSLPLDILVNSPNQSNAAVLMTDGWHSSFELRIGVSSGVVRISLGDATLDQLHVFGAANGPVPRVFISSGSGEVALATIGGGVVQSDAKVDHATIRRGRLILNGPTSSIDIEVAGGSFSYNVDDGTITSLYAMGGRTNLLGAGGREKTISNLFEFPGVKVIRDPGGNVVGIGRNRTFGLDKE